MKFYASALALVVLLFVGVFVSEQLNWYDQYPEFDSVLHFLGGFIVAWFVGHFLAHQSPRTYVTRIGLAVLVIGVLWEIAEYLAGVILPHDSIIYIYFHGGALPDTLLDLFLDMLGAGVFVLGDLFLTKKASLIQSEAKAPTESDIKSAAGF